MFDTSVVRDQGLAGSRRATFLISAFIHSFAIVAAVVLTVASTQLPVDPPRQLELYRAAPVAFTPPPPLGRPAVRPQQQHEQTMPRPRTIVAPPLTAPSTIPEQIPIAASDPGPANGPATTETSTGGQGPIGSPTGVPDGVGDGEQSVGSASGPYTPGGGVTEARVISRVEPRFPLAFAHSVREAIVVVRCVIGQDGAIHEPEIVRSSFPPFNDAVLSALRQWKFAPGMMHGRPVDTWFQLTVKFQVR
jgi:periplasmic protein TonB